MMVRYASTGHVQSSHLQERVGEALIDVVHVLREPIQDPPV